MFLINDANAGALAEKVYGYGKDVKNFVYLHITNGIGDIFTRNRSLLWSYTRETLEKHTLRESLRACKTVPSALGDKIGDYSTVCAAF